MRLRTLLFLTALGILVASCNMEALLREPPPPKLFHLKCTDCHASEEPDSSDTIGMCYNCHFKYFSNHHPVDYEREPGSISSTGSQTFPVIDGRVRCQSCHEIHKQAHPGDNPKLIRGGPYSDRRTPCFMCHFKEQYAGIYVHQMIGQGGNILKVQGKPVCLFCHREQPDPLRDRTRDVTFKADVGFLCWRCHPPMPETEFFGAHFLVTPARRTLKYMKRFEKKNTIILPIVPHDRITCSTCHNPHQRGVIKHEPATKGADASNRLRMTRQEICIACHQN